MQSMGVLPAGNESAAPPKVIKRGFDSLKNNENAEE
jgi:hypothetical protein